MFDSEGPGGVQLTPIDAPEDGSFVMDIPDEDAESQEPSGQEGQAPAQPAAQPGSPSPTQPADAQVPAVPPAETSAEPGTPAAPTPFTFRASNQDFELVGATVDEHGLHVPTDALEDLRLLLAEGAEHRGNWRQQEAQWQQRIADAENRAVAKEADVAKREGIANAMLASLDNLRRAGPEKVAEWLDNLDRNWDVMQLRAENELLKRAAESGQAIVGEQAVAQQAEALVPQLETTLQGYVSRLAQDPAYQGLDVQAIYQRLLDPAILDRVFFEADDAMARRYGIAPGTVMVDYDLIKGYFDRDANYLRSLSRAAESNVRQTIKAPPTVGGGRAVVTQPDAGTTQGGPAGRFRTKAEMDAYLDEIQAHGLKD